MKIPVHLKYGYFAKQSFLNIAPEAKQQLIQWNKQRKQWGKRWFGQGYKPIEHDTSHMLTSMGYSRTPGARDKGFGVRQYHESFVGNNLEGSGGMYGGGRYTGGSWQENLPTTNKPVHIYKRDINSDDLATMPERYDMIAQNSKGKVRPPGAQKAVMGYVDTAIDNLNNNPVLNEAYLGYQRATKQGFERQYDLHRAGKLKNPMGFVPSAGVRDIAFSYMTNTINL